MVTQDDLITFLDEYSSSINIQNFLSSLLDRIEFYSSNFYLHRECSLLLRDIRQKLSRCKQQNGRLVSLYHLLFILSQRSLDQRSRAYYFVVEQLIDSFRIKFLRNQPLTRYLSISESIADLLLSVTGPVVPLDSPLSVDLLWRQVEKELRQLETELKYEPTQTKVYLHRINVGALLNFFNYFDFIAEPSATRNYADLVLFEADLARRLAHALLCWKYPFTREITVRCRILERLVSDKYLCLSLNSIPVQDILELFEKSYYPIQSLIAESETENKVGSDLRFFLFSKFSQDLKCNVIPVQAIKEVHDLGKRIANNVFKSLTCDPTIKMIFANEGKITSEQLEKLLSSLAHEELLDTNRREITEFFYLLNTWCRQHLFEKEVKTHETISNKFE